MKVNIIPFDEKYLDGFVYDGVEKELLKDCDIKEIAKLYNRMGMAFMGIVDNRLVSMGGIYPNFSQGQAWMFINKEIKDYLKESIKSIREYMSLIIEKSGYKQIQISCLTNSPEANRLAEHMGFTLQAKMNVYIRRSL